MATSVGDMTVTIRAKDEVTPTLNRISRRLWWMRHGEAVIAAIWTLAVFAGGLVAGLNL